MKVKVLGCSGGIGGKHLRTTAFRVDNDVLIDAGTGVADLSLTELSMIARVRSENQPSSEREKVVVAATASSSAGSAAMTENKATMRT